MKKSMNNMLTTLKEKFYNRFQSNLTNEFIIIKIVVVLYSLGIICDAIYYITNPSVTNSIPDILKDVYVTVWGITIGIIVFVSQHGYATIYGLRMIDILTMRFSKKKIWSLAIFYIVKFGIYEIFYFNEMKYTVIMGQVEVFITFIFTIFIFVWLSEPEYVAKLLKEDTKRNVKALCENFDRVKIRWKLRKTIDMIDYSNMENCNIVVDNLSFLFMYEKLSFPEIDVNNGELVPSARSNCTTLPKQEYRLAGWLYRSATALCQRCEPLFR